MLHLINTFVCIGFILCNGSIQLQIEQNGGTVQLELGSVASNHPEYSDIIVVKQNNKFEIEDRFYLSCQLIPNLSADFKNQVVLYPENWLKIIPIKVQKAMQSMGFPLDLMKQPSGRNWRYDKDDNLIQNYDTKLYLTGNANTFEMSLQDNTFTDNQKWIYNSNTNELFWINPKTSKQHVVYLMSDLKKSIMNEATLNVEDGIKGRVKPFISVKSQEEFAEFDFIKLKSGKYLFSDGNSIISIPDLDEINYKYYGLWKYHKDTGYLQHFLSGKYVSIIPNDDIMMQHLLRIAPGLQSIPTDSYYNFKVTQSNQDGNFVKFTKAANDADAYDMYHESKELTRFIIVDKLELFIAFENEEMVQQFHAKFK